MCLGRIDDADDADDSIFVAHGDEDENYEV